MVIQRTARGFLNTVFRHRWHFAGIVLLFVAAGVAYAALSKPSFKSEALILVKFNGRTASSDALAAAAIQAQASERKEVMNSQARILQSQDLLLELVDAVGVDRIYPELAANPPSDGDLRNRAAKQLAKDLDVAPAKDATVLEVALLNRDPHTAALTLKHLIERFQARQSEIFLNPQSTFLQEQLEQARRQLSASQASVEAFKAEAGISSLEEERTLQLRLRAELHNNLAQQRARRSEAESRFQSLSKSLRSLPPQIQLSDENDRFKAIDDARARLTELRARETEMAANYRDDSVALRTLRAQIRFAEQDLEARSRDSLARVRTGPNPVYQQIQADLLRAQADAAAASAAIPPIEQQLAQVEARLADLDARQGRLQDLMLQMQVDEENFRSVLQRNEDARASEELIRQNISSIVTIQQPTVPLEPAKPRMAYILALCLIGGVAVACVVCFAWEIMDETFSLPEQITDVVKLPVLVSFETNRAAELRSNT